MLGRYSTLSFEATVVGKVFLHATLCMKRERWCFEFGFVFKFQVEQLAMPWIYIWSSREGFINIPRVRVLFLSCVWGWKDASVGRG